MCGAHLNSGSNIRALTVAAKQIEEATLDALWRQWAALGASAPSTGPTRAVIDPEALILTSLCLVEREPRLGDLVAHWGVLNGASIGIQRMKNLAARFPDVLESRLPAFARLVHDEAKDARWKSLIRPNVPALPYRSGKTLSVRTPLTRPPAVMLRLRALFGIDVRADAIAFLLTYRGSYPYVSTSDVAAAIGFNATAVKRVLEALADAHWLSVANDPYLGFSTTDSPLTTLIASEKNETSVWYYCADMFAFATDFLRWVAHLPKQPVSDFALYAIVGKLLERHWRAFVENGLVPRHQQSLEPEQMRRLLDATIELIATKL
jgi:hypothetical protein